MGEFYTNFSTTSAELLVFLQISAWLPCCLLSYLLLIVWLPAVQKLKKQTKKKDYSKLETGAMYNSLSWIRSLAVHHAGKHSLA